MKTTKTYQVWACLRREDGTEVWHAVTRKFKTRAAAQRVATELWLVTRINVEDEDPED